MEKESNGFSVGIFAWYAWVFPERIDFDFVVQAKGDTHCVRNSIGTSLLADLATTAPPKKDEHAVDKSLRRKSTLGRLYVYLVLGLVKSRLFNGSHSLTHCCA